MEIKQTRKAEELQVNETNSALDFFLNKYLFRDEEWSNWRQK